MDENAGASFVKPPRTVEEPTSHLYIANCGPGVGISYEAIVTAFGSFGVVSRIIPAGDSGSRVVVSFENLKDAVAAKEAWHGRPCSALDGRRIFVQYALPQPKPAIGHQQLVFTNAALLEIPGLQLYTDFVSAEEEQCLLDSVDQLPWNTLAKRKVQHYGYEFLYKTRNVDLSKRLGSLPPFVERVVQQITSVTELAHADEPTLPLDQLTVNDYSRGVGLSPHIDTHSAFEGSIISLSLAGPCVMEFRKYSKHSVRSGATKESTYEKDESGLGKEHHEVQGTMAMIVESHEDSDSLPLPEVERKALFLPPRSLLVLSGEARYAWHHYIPHHKVDIIDGKIISRAPRRVSFTFRKVRRGPCHCRFEQFCDSQSSGPLNSELCLDLASKGAVDPDNVAGLVKESMSCQYELTTAPNKSQLFTKNAVNDPVENINFSEDTTCPQSSLDLAGSCKADRNLTSLNRKIKSNDNSRERSFLLTPGIEKQYVHGVYDAIAPHFNSTRFAKWPKVALFLGSLKPGSMIADAGCGNGKYLGFNSRCIFVGCDISPPLVNICAKKGHEAFIGDALCLPYRNGLFDAAISIAVLHHLSNEPRRRRAIEELVRIVGVGGKILITVWAVEQEDESLLRKWTPLSTKYREEGLNDGDFRYLQKQNSCSSLEKIQEEEGISDGQCDEDLRASMICHRMPGKEINATCIDRSVEARSSGRGSAVNNGSCVDGDIIQGPHQEYFVPWHLPYHRAEISGAAAASVKCGFAKRDEKKAAVVYNRYYHVFVEGELERLALGISRAVVVDRFYDKSNWCIVLQKF